MHKHNFIYNIKLHHLTIRSALHALILPTCPHRPPHHLMWIPGFPTIPITPPTHNMHPPLIPQLCLYPAATPPQIPFPALPGVGLGVDSVWVCVGVWRRHRRRACVYRWVHACTDLAAPSTTAKLCRASDLKASIELTTSFFTQCIPDLPLHHLQCATVSISSSVLPLYSSSRRSTVISMS